MPEKAAVPRTYAGMTSASVPSGYLSGFPYLGVPYGGFATPGS